MSGQKITLVVAMARNGVIGRDGGLPWHIASDLRRFKTVTMGKPVIMGRKTWDSLPRKPLPGRVNIVLTRDGAFEATGAVRAATVAGALAVAGPVPEVCIIGGGEIYRLFMPLATHLDRTLVEMDAEGETRFPDVSARDWRIISDTPHDQGPDDSAAFRVQTFERLFP